MTRDELVAVFRARAQDTVEEYLWPTPQVAAWLAEAEIEACIRGRLIHESDDAGVCQIGLSSGTARYALHPALYEIDHLAVLDGSRRRPVRLVSQDWLDGNVREWRDLSGFPEYAIQGDTYLRLIPRPNNDGLLVIEGYRLPFSSIADDGSAEPEIHQAHHLHLVDWALYRAFGVPTAETLDLSRAAAAEHDFTAYFGARPDCDIRRTTRIDVEHHNKAWP